MNPNLIKSEVQSFLNENLNTDLDRLILKGSPFKSISARELAEQIKSRRKCRTKLPLWFESPGIIYPKSLNIEQSSSETTARYKASLINGDSLVDLTGGFGVDAYFFSKQFKKVTHVELNQELHAIVRHNLEELEVENISCVAGDSMEFLSSSQESFDWIYIDPSRRGQRENRVFLLEDCTPDVLGNLDLILSKCEGVLLKLSPLMDLSKAINQLKNVREIRVLAIDNEVKELLFLLGKEEGSVPSIKAVNMTRRDVETLESQPELKDEITYGSPNLYLYEPNAAIRKAGLYRELSSKYKLLKLHPNSHLFTGDSLVDFPGRSFEITKAIPYKAKRIKKDLGIQHAHITTRNFRESVAQIRKRTGIKEGGENYLFFTTDPEEKALVLVCKKIDRS